MALTTFSNWLLQAPLGTIAFVSFGGMILAMLIGWVVRRRLSRSSVGKANSDDKDDSGQSIVISAVMGSLALLFAFTFAIALDRFDARRSNVLYEANAVGTTYLRAQLLEEPHRSRISKLLVDYTDGRIALAGTPQGTAQAALLRSNDQLLADLWTATVAAFPSMRPYNYSVSFLETMNNLIDMDAMRKAGRQAHVPPAVFLVLFLYQFVAAGVVSYAVVSRESRRTALLLFLLLSTLLVLIIDIDRPMTGQIVESQEPMLQLRAFMEAQPPKSFDRFSLPPAPAGKN
jgi:hypothetical protein